MAKKDTEFNPEDLLEEAQPEEVQDISAEGLLAEVSGDEEPVDPSMFSKLKDLGGDVIEGPIETAKTLYGAGKGIAKTGWEGLRYAADALSESSGLGDTMPQDEEMAFEDKIGQAADAWGQMVKGAKANPEVLVDTVGRTAANTAGAGVGATLGLATGLAAPVAVPVFSAAGVAVSNLAYSTLRWLTEGGFSEDALDETLSDTAKGFGTDMVTGGVGSVAKQLKGTTKLGRVTRRMANKAKAENSVTWNIRKALTSQSTGIDPDRLKAISENPLTQKLVQEMALTKSAMGDLVEGKSFERAVQILKDPALPKGQQGWIDNYGKTVTRLLSESETKPLWRESKALIERNAKVAFLGVDADDTRLYKMATDKINGQLEKAYAKKVFAQKQGGDPYPELKGDDQFTLDFLDDWKTISKKKAKLESLSAQIKEYPKKIGLAQDKITTLSALGELTEDGVMPAKVQGILDKLTKNSAAMQKRLDYYEMLKSEVGQFNKAMSSTALSPNEFWEVINTATDGINWKDLSAGEAGALNKGLAKIRGAERESLKEGMDSGTKAAYDRASKDYGDLKDLHRWAQASINPEFARVKPSNLIKEALSVAKGTIIKEPIEKVSALHYFLKARELMFDANTDASTPFARKFLNNIADKWPQKLGSSVEDIFTIENSYLLRNTIQLADDTIESSSDLATPQDIGILERMRQAASTVEQFIVGGITSGTPEKLAIINQMLKDPDTAAFVPLDEVGGISSKAKTIAGRPVSLTDETIIFREIENNDTLSNVEKAKMRRHYRKTGAFQPIEDRDANLLNNSDTEAYRKEIQIQAAKEDLFKNRNPLQIVRRGTATAINKEKQKMESTKEEIAGPVSEFEGFRETAYKDEGGVWTIGYGSTKLNGKPVQKGDTISEEEARSQRDSDLSSAMEVLNKHVKVPLGSGQEQALSSLIYNIGESRFIGSTLLKKLNAGDYEGAAEEFSKWHFVKGTPSKGLKARRAKEAEMFALDLDQTKQVS